MPTDKLDSSLSDQCCPDTDPDIFVFKHFDNSSSSNVELPMLSSVMMRPLYLENSAWIGHIPFAFWIIEAQKPHILVELGVYYGVSYFAFCQAVERLGLDASCFAVDTWKGDEHAGYYDESVYEQFKRYNDFHYSEFSFLIRNSFDNAKDYFTDGTIDLLHIDGLHTYEAVKHDFENWLPKLSSRAIVLFHDSNVREREFGVFKFVQELRDTYPSFEFMHGHGLSVFGVGRNQDSVFDNLFKMKDHDRNKANISKVFGLLGKSCVDAHHLNVRTDKLSSSERLSKKLESEIQKLRENQEKLLPRLQLADQAQERIAGIEKESQIQVAIIQDKLQTFQEQLLAEQKFNERLLVQIERCNQEVQEREAAETKLRDQIAAQDTALAQLKTQAAQQADQAKAEREGLLVEREAAETKLRDQIAAQDTALTQLKTQAAQQADQAKAEIKNLRIEIARLTDAHEQDLKIVYGNFEELKIENDKLKIDIRDRFCEVAMLTSRLEVLRGIEAECEILKKDFSRNCEKLTVLEKENAQYPSKIELIVRDLFKLFGACLDNGYLLREKISDQIRDANFFDSSWYLLVNKDVSIAGIDPLSHFLSYGMKEGRLPCDLNAFVSKKM